MLVEHWLSDARKRHIALKVKGKRKPKKRRDTGSGEPPVSPPPATGVTDAASPMAISPRGWEEYRDCGDVPDCATCRRVGCGWCAEENNCRLPRPGICLDGSTPAQINNDKEC